MPPPDVKPVPQPTGQNDAQLDEQVNDLQDGQQNDGQNPEVTGDQVNNPVDNKNKDEEDKENKKSDEPVNNPPNDRQQDHEQRDENEHKDNAPGGDKGKIEEEDNRSDKQKKKDAEKKRKDRFDVLKKKLVDDHKAAKEEKGHSSVDDPDAVTHSSQVKHLGNADKAAEYIGYGGIAGSAAAAVGPSVLKYGAKGLNGMGKYEGKALGHIIGDESLKNNNGIPELDDFATMMGNASDKASNDETKTKNEQITSDVINGTATAGSTLSTISSGIQLVSGSVRAAKDKNKYKRRVGKYNALTGAAGLVGNGSKALSSAANLGLFGKRADVAGSTSSKIAGSLDILGGLGSAAAGFLNFKKTGAEKEGHKEAAQAANNYHTANSGKANQMLGASRETIAQYGKAGDLSDNQREELRMARQARHTAKAQKYAMKQAADMHDLRSKEMRKGVGGMIGSAIGGIGSILTGIAKITGAPKGIFGTLGTVFAGLGGVASTVGGITDFAKGRSEKKKVAAKHKEIVDEYLEEKISKIKDQAAAAAYTDEEAAKLGEKQKQISDAEARKIAIMRLGVELDASSAGIPESAYEKAFEKLSEKRANNILRSAAKEKGEMLEALGLDKDATFEDVVEALKAT